MPMCQVVLLVLVGMWMGLMVEAELQVVSGRWSGRGKACEAVVVGAGPDHLRYHAGGRKSMSGLSGGVGL